MAETILHLIPTLELAGAAKQLCLLAGRLPRDEFDVHVCVLGRGGPWISDLRAAKVPTRVIGQRWRADPLAFARLVRHIRQVQPALVHTWQFSAGVYGRLAARLAGAPSVIASEHSIDPKRTMAAWAMERRLARRTDRLVTSSTAVRDVGIEHGLAAEKFTVIAAGVPTAPDSDVTREDLFRELELPTDARLIGAIGRHVPMKRTTDLIWAADLIRVLHDNMRLLVIGDGPERPQLERFARLASDLDHIRFLGERHDLWRIMPHLDVLWHGSTHEGQSNTVMEAMAAGVPVVASDIPGHRELVVDGETGYLVPIAARAARVRHTDRLLREPELAGRLGDAARARMREHFTVERMVERYAELYREVLGMSSDQLSHR